MEKMTKKEMFNQLLANYDLTATEIEFIQHEIALLEKKNKSTGKPTKTQVENTKLMNSILDKMEIGKEYTVTEIQMLFNGQYSNQKISSLMKKLVDTEQAIRSVVKGKAEYSRKA